MVNSSSSSSSDDSNNNSDSDGASGEMFLQQKLIEQSKNMLNVKRSSKTSSSSDSSDETKPIKSKSKLSVNPKRLQQHFGKNLLKHLSYSKLAHSISDSDLESDIEDIKTDKKPVPKQEIGKRRSILKNSNQKLPTDNLLGSIADASFANAFNSTQLPNVKEKQKLFARSSVSSSSSESSSEEDEKRKTVIKIENKSSSSSDDEQDKTLNNKTNKINLISKINQKEIHSNSLASFINTHKHLKKIEDGTNFTLEDLNSDDEISVIQCPKTVNVNKLLKHESNFENESKFKLKIDGNRYECVSQPADNSFCLVASKSNRNRNLSAQIIKPVRTLVLHEKLKSHSQIHFEPEEKSTVKLPDNLKVRHPIFGIDYQHKIVLDDTIQLKLIKAEQERRKEERKAFKRNEKRKRNNSNSSSKGKNDEMIFQLLNQTTSLYANEDKSEERSRKRKHSIKEDEEIEVSSIKKKKKNRKLEQSVSTEKKHNDKEASLDEGYKNLEIYLSKKSKKKIKGVEDSTFIEKKPNDKEISLNEETEDKQLDISSPKKKKAKKELRDNIFAEKKHKIETSQVEETSIPELNDSHKKKKHKKKKDKSREEMIETLIIENKKDKHENSDINKSLEETTHKKKKKKKKKQDIC